MIGSLTFIMVALRWSDAISPSFSQRLSSSSKKVRSLATSIRAASITSPASSAVDSFSTVVDPSADTCSMRTSHAAFITADCSEPKKSPSVMWRTSVREPSGHLPSLCGLFCAYTFTGGATRRSELPSRSTGLTAEPRTLAYFAAISRSASVDGDAG